MKNRKRTILALSLFAVAIAAGIIQYNFGPFTFDGANLADVFDGNKDSAFGEAVLVGNLDATPIADAGIEEETTAPEEEAPKTKNMQEVQSGEIDDSTKSSDSKKENTAESVENEEPNNEESEFEQAKLERDEMRSRSREQLEAAVAVSSDTIVSSEAQQSLLKLTETENLESKVESLLQQKGYKQTMVYIGTDDSMDIVVNAKKITPAEAAGIADTASRHSGIDVNEIVIKCLK